MTTKIERYDNIETIREYVQRDYWESGHDKKISGYQDSFINWWWINRWMQCFAEVFAIKDKKVLDLGCAYGSMVAGFLTWGADAYGIDLSDYAIAKGIKEADYLQNRIFQGSIHDLSRFDDNTFDIIYSNQVFEHLPEKYVTNLVNEMMRVARPGAILWLAFVISEEENGVRKANDPDETHINIHSMDWWRKRFSQVGFIEDRKLNNKIMNTYTGYDHYSFYKYYGWDSIVLRKPCTPYKHLANMLRTISIKISHTLPIRLKNKCSSIPCIKNFYKKIVG